LVRQVGKPRHDRRARRGDARRRRRPRVHPGDPARRRAPTRGVARARGRTRRDLMPNAVEVSASGRRASHEAAAILFPLLGLVLVVVADTTAARWASLAY